MSELKHEIKDGSEWIFTEETLITVNGEKKKILPGTYRFEIKGKNSTLIPITKGSKGLKSE